MDSKNINQVCTGRMCGNIKVAFDCEKYKQKQKETILKRCKQDENSILYIEVGGKIINDFHSTRVLPGYRPDLKFEFVNELFPNAEFICCISAKDIDTKRQRGDFSIGYDKETFRLIEELKERGKEIKKVAITRITKGAESQAVINFENEAKKKGLEVIKFYENSHYKPDAGIVPGLDQNPFIRTDAKQVIITAPGANSGKFGVCLNQIFHEMKNGKAPQYIKIETFPIHNLPVDHLINQAYASATADSGDKVMVDKNSSNATSYNRDLDNFELLKFTTTLFDENVSKYLRVYNSPTSMGINCLKDGIIDDDTVQRESAAEIARRFVRYYQEYSNGKEKKETVLTAKKILLKLSEII